MSGSDPALDRALAALRREYLADSPRRLVELWTTFARAQQGDRAGLAELKTALHRLAGTGGAYGLPAVTEHARAGESVAHDLLAGEAPPDEGSIATLRLHIQNLADAFAAASGPE